MKKNTSRYMLELLSQPLYKLYSGSLRKWKYGSLDLLVMPGIFHPGWFVTSAMLLDKLERMDVEGKKFLELGCGTGTQACRAAQKGAIAYASDITPAASVNASLNAERNCLNVQVMSSDLFDQFPDGLSFDYIFVNPPFIPKYPENERDFAFCAGEEYEYYECLFSGLRERLTPQGQLIMALAQSCDINRILQIAALEGLCVERTDTARRYAETNFLYSITLPD